MKILVKGSTQQIEKMTSEDEVHFSNSIETKHPLGEESLEQFEERNRRFLSALLSVYFGEDDDPVEDESVVVPKIFQYS